MDALLDYEQHKAILVAIIATAYIDPKADDEDAFAGVRRAKRVVSEILGEREFEE